MALILIVFSCCSVIAVYIYICIWLIGWVRPLISGELPAKEHVKFGEIDETCNHSVSWGYIASFVSRTKHEVPRGL